MLEKILNNIKKSFRSITTSIVTLSLVAISAFISGCDEYNRADISQDGKQIAFSLNSKGGFDTDSSSEMYVIKIDDSGKIEMKRKTIDDECDSWASFSYDGSSLLSVKGAPKENGDTGIYLNRVESDESVRLTGYLSPYSNFPFFIGDNSENARIFYSYLGVNQSKKSYEIVCTATKPKSEEISGGPPILVLEEIVRIPIFGEKERLWSTTPAFSSDDKMYYAVGKLIEYTEDTKAKKLLDIKFYSVDLNTKDKKEVGEIYLLNPDGIGFADLAVSPDNKRLLCCFLSQEGNKINVENFDDSKPSLVYGINLEDGNTKEFGKIHMYNPCFVPIFKKSENEPTIEPANSEETGKENPSLEEKVEEEYTPEIVYLSGKGYESNGRSVIISDLNGHDIELARLPDKIMSAYTGWAWLSKDRLRIFQIGESGLILIDTNKDGTNQQKGYFDREHLALLKEAADLQPALDHFQKFYELTLSEFTRNMPLAKDEQGQEIYPSLDARQDYLSLQQNIIKVLENRVERAKQAASGISFKEGEYPQTPQPILQQEPAIKPKETKEEAQ